MKKHLLIPLLFLTIGAFGQTKITKQDQQHIDSIRLGQYLIGFTTMPYYTEKRDTILSYCLVAPNMIFTSNPIGIIYIDKTGHWHEDKVAEEDIHPVWIMGYAVSNGYGEAKYLFMDKTPIENQVLISIPKTTK